MALVWPPRAPVLVVGMDGAPDPEGLGLAAPIWQGADGVFFSGDPTAKEPPALHRESPWLARLAEEGRITLFARAWEARPGDVVGWMDKGWPRGEVPETSAETLGMLWDERAGVYLSLRSGPDWELRLGVAGRALLDRVRAACRARPARLDETEALAYRAQLCAPPPLDRELAREAWFWLARVAILKGGDAALELAAAEADLGAEVAAQLRATVVRRRIVVPRTARKGRGAVRSSHAGTGARVGVPLSTGILVLMDGVFRLVQGSTAPAPRPFKRFLPKKKRGLKFSQKTARRRTRRGRAQVIRGDLDELRGSRRG